MGRRVDGGLQTVSLGHNRASDLNPCLVSASPEGLQVHPLRDPASLCGQLQSPFAHNSLRASLSLPQALAAHPAVHAQAWARVRWVRSCLQALHRCCARAGQAPDAPLLQLYSEVTALADLLSNMPHAPQPCH